MAWKTAEPDEKAEIVRAITWAQPAFRRDPNRCTVDLMELPFYPDSQLLKLTTRDLPGKPLWYVRLPKKIESLDKQADSIHHCNTAAPLVLNDKTVYPYLRFWYYFADNIRVFEARVRRSAVGYTGKVWLFDKEHFYEADINLSPRGTVTLLERTSLPEVPDFETGDFSL